MSIQYLTAPCGCIINCPSKIILLLGASEEHLALHRELDVGIEHNLSCREPAFKEIPLPQLVINEKLLKELTHD